ncbi:MAG: hypothetical protein GKR90_06150 [Pseudomonadales bacterium]|nr:hypothetical protein [Pseudomonadales bacterium]
MGKVVLAFVVAVVATYAVGTITYSQLNLAQLVEMGVDIGLSTRLDTTFHDFLGMTQIYLPALTFALLLGLSIAFLVLKVVPQLRYLGFVVGGAVALLAMNMALTEAAGGIHGLAVTRTTMGLLSQCFAGAVGGYAFALVRDKQGVPGKSSA